VAAFFVENRSLKQGAVDDLNITGDPEWQSRRGSQGFETIGRLPQARSRIGADIRTFHRHINFLQGSPSRTLLGFEHTKEETYSR